MSNIDNDYWCPKCVAMSILPRISFASASICHARQRASKKQQLDLETGLETSKDIIQRQKTKAKTLNFLVPASAGDEDLCLACQLKHTRNINPLCLTIQSSLPSDTG